MPNEKPDPECKDCKGTGQITLFTSSCACDCVSKSLIAKEVIEKCTKQYEYNMNTILRTTRRKTYYDLRPR